jgi:hypothetical protein
MHPGDKVSSRHTAGTLRGKQDFSWLLPPLPLCPGNKALSSLLYPTSVSGSLLENLFYTSHFIWINEIIPLYSEDGEHLSSTYFVLACVCKVK